MEGTDTSASARAEQYYAGLGAHGVDALWRQLGTLLPPEPKSRATPHLWRYAELRELLLEAGEVVTAEEAERRVLMLMNPGLAPKAAAATNLYAGLQLVLPGEIAPAHRHAAAALRFVVEGEGAYTAVNGERTLMRPGDLVLTPAWAWHDHGNESDRPMIWLDGLDLPLINDMEANFFGGAQEQAQAQLVPADSSTRRYALGRLNPVWDGRVEGASPLLNYPWSQTEQVLAAAARDTDGTPADGLLFEYAHPYTGGAVMPTLACFVQALKPGFRGTAHRHTSSAVYHVVRGAGTTVVDGEELSWGARDTFAVPGWSEHAHANGSASEDAVLFSFTDEPVMRALGYYQERTRSEEA